MSVSEPDSITSSSMPIDTVCMRKQYHAQINHHLRYFCDSEPESFDSVDASCPEKRRSEVYNHSSTPIPGNTTSDSSALAFSNANYNGKLFYSN